MRTPTIFKSCLVNALTKSSISIKYDQMNLCALSGRGHSFYNVTLALTLMNFQFEVAMKLACNDPRIKLAGKTMITEIKLNGAAGMVGKYDEG